MVAYQPSVPRQCQEMEGKDRGAVAPAERSCGEGSSLGADGGEAQAAPGRCPAAAGLGG
jgi:hypothetical protein